jgi:hypothetical protein
MACADVSRPAGAIGGLVLGTKRCALPCALEDICLSFVSLSDWAAFSRVSQHAHGALREFFTRACQLSMVLRDKQDALALTLALAHARGLRKLIVAGAHGLHDTRNHPATTTTGGGGRFMRYALLQVSRLIRLNQGTLQSVVTSLASDAPSMLAAVRNCPHLTELNLTCLHAKRLSSEVQLQLMEQVPVHCRKLAIIALGGDASFDEFQSIIQQGTLTRVMRHNNGALAPCHLFPCATFFLAPCGLFMALYVALLCEKVKVFVHDACMRLALT